MKTKIPTLRERDMSIESDKAKPSAGFSVSRRRFLGASSAATVFTIVPSHVLGQSQDTPAPSNTITYGVIGNGSRKDAGLRGNKAFRKIAVCDVDASHMAKEADGVTRYRDFRELLDQKDIDCVCIATPPHWHAIPCIAAAQAGKDIFCEKPFTKFIAEGRPVVEAVRRYGVVFQIGTFKRFSVNRSIHKLCASGLLKDMKGVVAHAGAKNRTGNPALPGQKIPESLDYDLWLGPAPYKPYNGKRVHYSNRFYWDYEGGDLTNFGFHSFDPIQYQFAKDETGPVEVEPVGSWPQHPDVVGKYDSAVLTYADGFKVVVGNKGTKSVNIGGSRKLDPKELGPQDKAKFDAMPDPPALVKFEEAVRTRQQAGGHAESSHRASTALNLANIAIRLGRKIRWDPVAEKIVGDEEASRLVDIPMRGEWHL